MFHVKKFFARLLLATLNSGFADTFVMLLACYSFYQGQVNEEMSIFAAAGGPMTVFGLLKMIRFTTIEKYLASEKTVQQQTGMTGPLVGPGQEEAIRKTAQLRMREKLRKELNSEFWGIFLTVAGTLIASYGSFNPVFS